MTAFQLGRPRRRATAQSEPLIVRRLPAGEGAMTLVVLAMQPGLEAGRVTRHAGTDAPCRRRKREGELLPLWPCPIASRFAGSPRGPVGARGKWTWSVMTTAPTESGVDI